MNMISGKMFVKLPFTPGSECSGTIIKAANKELIGQNVAFLAIDGSWRNYGIGNMN